MDNNIPVELPSNNSETYSTMDKLEDGGVTVRYIRVQVSGQGCIT
jgi:hypothetical protein